MNNSDDWLSTRRAVRVPSFDVQKKMSLTDRQFKSGIHFIYLLIHIFLNARTFWSCHVWLI